MANADRKYVAESTNRAMRHPAFAATRPPMKNPRIVAVVAPMVR